MLNWTDALSVTRGGPGMLAPHASVAITVWFTAREDTHIEGGLGTANRLSVTLPLFDPDGPGPLPAGASLTAQSAIAYARIYQSTGITVLSFQAVADQGQVTLTWQTANEAQLLGFNVLRRPSGGPMQALNTELILAEYAGANQGMTYTYRDRPSAGAYAYSLEVIRLDGSRAQVGSVAVKVGQLLLR